MPNRLRLLWLCICLSCQGFALADPGIPEGGNVDVSEIVLSTSDIVQGEPVTLTYRIAGDANVSATACIHPGDLSAAPKPWQKDAFRPEPRYQLSKIKLGNRSQNVTVAFPGAVTRRMSVGPHTVFLAISNPPNPWKMVRVGTVNVGDEKQLPVPIRSGPPRVAVWWNERSDSCSAELRRTMARAVNAVGAQASFLRTEEFSDSTKFSRDSFEALVLPCGSSVPAMAPIEAFLERAGAVVNLGGVPFLQTDSRLSNTPEATNLLLDAETPESVRAFAIEKGPESRGSLERTKSGDAGAGYGVRVTVPDLDDWLYVSLPVRADAGDALQFRAKGDTTTDRLCLEATTRDGSRWKYFVALSTEWRECVVRLENFSPYAGPALKSRGQALAAQSIARIRFGVFKALYASKQTHTFWLDDVAFVYGPPASAADRLDHAKRWAASYKALRIRPRLDLLGLWDGVGSVDAHGIRPVEQHPLMSATPAIAGTSTCWSPSPALAGSAALSGVAPFRHVPLCMAVDAKGQEQGVAAGMLFYCRGPYRGARVVYWSAPPDQLLAERDSNAPGDREEVLAALLRVAFSPCLVYDLAPDFSAGNGSLRQEWRISVANVSGQPQTPVVRLTTTNKESATLEVSLAPGEVRRIGADLKADSLDLKCFGARADMALNGKGADRLTATADVLNALQVSADWLMSGQTDAGNYSNYFYADTYGARALRALGCATGETRYERSAWKMADMMVRDQREDGGWWVGYGAPGECVFVADNGSIALGLVQMASRADRERRTRYTDAVRRYIAFRESFRITDAVATELEAQYGADHRGILRGGLGIGYVRTDYFTRERFPAQHREMRQMPWTLHVSLACVAGQYRLTGDASTRRLAVQDARWLLDRCADRGDSVRNPYANEAAVWVRDLVDDADLRERIDRELRDRFLDDLAQTGRPWWRSSDGRGALLLPGLITCMRELDDSLPVRAAVVRAIWAICSDESTDSTIQTVARAGENRKCPDMMYICFSANGLAELLWPRSTMMPPSEAK